MKIAFTVYSLASTGMLFRGYLPIMSGWAMAQFLNGLDLNGSSLKPFLLENSERGKDYAVAAEQASDLAHAREALVEAACPAAEQAGRAMDYEQAMAEIGAWLKRSEPRVAGSVTDTSGGLTHGAGASA